MRKDSRFLAWGGVTAALYVVLTFVSSAFGLSSGVIQLRLSEALCILPCVSPAAIPGLAIGCLLANLLTGAVALDVVFGSIATLLGAVGTYLLRNHRFLACLPPIVSNMIIIPIILTTAYQMNFGSSFLYIVLSVGIGEFISCGVLGQLVLSAMKKIQK